MPETFEALIIGGGPSGSTAAILLARSGWRVAIIEKVAFPRGTVCGETDLRLAGNAWCERRRPGSGARIWRLGRLPEGVDLVRPNDALGNLARESDPLGEGEGLAVMS